jgi:HTH-type transcriptional regulator / antitoxin HigA
MKVERVIRDVTTYKNVLKRINEIINAKPGSKEYDELELLSILVENYENQKYKIPESDPIDIIEFLMEQRNLKQTDLIGILGDKTYVSKILNRKRSLTLDMIRNLSDYFHISSELLIKKYDLQFAS